MSIVDGIIELLNNSKLSKEFGENGRLMVKNEFSIQNTVSGHNKYFSALLT